MNITIIFKKYFASEYISMNMYIFCSKIELTKIKIN